MNNAPAFIVDSSNEDAMSAAKKLIAEFRPGAIIRVTAGEFEAIRDGFLTINFPPWQAAVERLEAAIAQLKESR